MTLTRLGGCSRTGGNQTDAVDCIMPTLAPGASETATLGILASTIGTYGVTLSVAGGVPVPNAPGTLQIVGDSATIDRARLQPLGEHRTPAPRAIVESVAPLEEDVIALAGAPNFAVLTTLTATGAPAATLVWIDVDGDDLLVNTERHRRKYRNVLRDPRVSVLVVDREDPGHYAAVEGLVTSVELGAGARAHIDVLARKYQGSDFDASRIRSERVILRIGARRQQVRRSVEVVE